MFVLNLNKFCHTSPQSQTGVEAILQFQFTPNADFLYFSYIKARLWQLWVLAIFPISACEMMVGAAEESSALQCCQPTILDKTALSPHVLEDFADLSHV